MLKSQDSHGLAPLPSQSITRTRVTKTYERVGGGVHCVCACMRAYIHAAIILWGAEQDPETGAFLSANTGLERGRGSQRTPGVTVQISEEYS